MKMLPFLKRIPRTLPVLILPLALFLIGWWFGLPPAKESTATAGAAEVWTCSMHPQIRQPQFGLCPLCNMDLIILEAGNESGLREISITPEAVALLDIRIAPVTRDEATHEVRLFGRIDPDERRVSTLTARAAGRLEKLFVDFTGADVAQGDPLAEIFSPDLLVIQRELIEARRALDALPADANATLRDTRRRLVDSARERLRLLQFDDAQITAIETQNTPTDRLTLRAPQSGIVTEKVVNPGDYVSTGDPLYRIADLRGVWLNLEAYENDLPWLRVGQQARFDIAAHPGRTFEGTIVFIEPGINPTRRIARLRLDVENPDLTLKPGMFATARVTATLPGENALLVPASAVLQTGPRAIVYVRLPEEPTPVFEGREIILGPRVGDRYIVASGLSEGENVVTRGAFKLDSELQIKGRPSMMNPDAGLAERPAHDAPESLAAQWQPILRALHRLIDAPSTQGLAQIKSLIRSINTEQLQPDELALWNEFSRRLLNDLELASQTLATTPSESLALTTRAIERTGRFLGLPYEPAALPPVDPAIAAELRKALDHYLPVSQALADDNDEAATQAARQLADSLQGELRTLAEAVAIAPDIKARRTAFQPLSDHLIAQIRAHAIDAIGNAYVVHCPMAFGNTGGDWLSATPEVLNPYYGDRMLTCGTVTDTLSVEPQSK